MAISIEPSVGLKEEENAERNRLMGNALVDQVCDECRR